MALVSPLHHPVVLKKETHEKNPPPGSRECPRRYPQGGVASCLEAAGGPQNTEKGEGWGGVAVQCRSMAGEHFVAVAAWLSGSSTSHICAVRSLWKEVTLNVFAKDVHHILLESVCSNR